MKLKSKKQTMRKLILKKKFTVYFLNSQKNGKISDS